MTAPDLRATGITVVRGGRTILDRVSVTVSPGERVALIGPSGVGKSTLLATLAGLERPDHGTIHLGQTDITGSTDPLVRRRFGIVLQAYGLVSLLTAAENVELALQARRLPRARIAATAAEHLAAVGLAGRADHLVEELSGGEQQRVAIARALATEPDIVLADEPTAELDAQARKLVLELLLDSVDGEHSLVIATHDREVAARCDRQIALDANRGQLPAATDEP